MNWLVIILASFMLGISKAGVKGLGILLVTLMALMFGGKASTGILMPMLIFGDVFAVKVYTKYVKWKYLMSILPWMFIGVLIGVLAGKDMPEAIFKRIMSGIILMTVLFMLYMEKRKAFKVPNMWWFGSFMGTCAGFTTMIGNLAGVFTNIYFLVMRLPKHNFVGTVAWIYFLTNLFKLPFHIFVWETVSVKSLALNLWLFPAMAVGLFCGVKLIDRIKELHFRKLILILTALGAILMMIQ